MLTINEQCNGCARCVHICPRGALTLRSGAAFLPDRFQCLECAACALNCPRAAIEVTKGTGCLAAIIKEDILHVTPKGTGCGCGDSPGGCC